MKIVSFNINSIRARLHQLEAVIEKHAPEVIGLQETKVSDEDFPLEAVQSLGYQVQYHGQKGHYGVALLSKKTPESVIKGFPEDGEESQKRFVGCTFLQENGRKLSVFNGYFPQGENRDHPLKFPAKRKFYADLKHYLSQNLGDDHDCVLMGDANVAPLDIDIGIGEQNKKRWLNTGKCCFLPEERAWLADVMELGLLDVYRHFYPNQACYSWFDYRSRGFEADPKRGLRIDLILVNSPLLKRCKDAGIDHDIRGMEKPSDHSPVWVEVE